MAREWLRPGTLIDVTLTVCINRIVIWGISKASITWRKSYKTVGCWWGKRQYLLVLKIIIILCKKIHSKTFSCQEEYTIKILIGLRSDGSELKRIDIDGSIGVNHHSLLLDGIDAVCSSINKLNDCNGLFVDEKTTYRWSIPEILSKGKG
jgi:hypothetical protein